MTEHIDPKDYGLPSSTKLERNKKGNICLVMDRKSRIIMADGKKILEKAKKIFLKEPGAKVCLKTSAPVCSKTLKFLEDQEIAVKPL